MCVKTRFGQKYPKIQFKYLYNSNVLERGRQRCPCLSEMQILQKSSKFLGFHKILEMSVDFTKFEEFQHSCENGVWRAPNPPPTAKFRALRGGFLKSWVSQGRIMYPKPWSLQGGFLEKWIGIKGGGGGLLFPPLVPASLLSQTLSSHHPLHPWIRIQCHLRYRKLHLVALK